MKANEAAMRSVDRDDGPTRVGIGAGCGFTLEFEPKRALGDLCLLGDVDRLRSCNDLDGLAHLQRQRLDSRWAGRRREHSCRGLRRTETRALQRMRETAATTRLEPLPHVQPRCSCQRTQLVGVVLDHGVGEQLLAHPLDLLAGPGLHRSRRGRPRCTCPAARRRRR